jgi:signal transduction histidine kinase
MPTESTSTRHLRTSRRLLVIFSVTVLVPGMILGVLGLRALTQQRRDAETQVRKTLQVTAENKGRQLELTFQDWQQAVDELARSGSEDPTEWPARVRDVLATPGFGVVLLGDREHMRRFPAKKPQYQLKPELETVVDESSASFLEAESLEVREKQFDRAISLYQQLAASTKPGERILALKGLARTFANIGRKEDALRTYRQLEKEPPVRLGLVPSDLLARAQIVALEDESLRAEEALRFYRDLVAGQWRLDHVMYAHYSHEARQSIARNEETVRLMAEEDLDLAVERFLESPSSLNNQDETVSLAFWHSQPDAVIILGEPWLRANLPPSANNEDLEAALFTPEGQALVGSNSLVASEPIGRYTLQSANFPLRLQVWAKNPSTLYAAVNRQQNLYLAMLAVLVALLGFGGYFTIQTLKSELAVAQMKSDFVSTVSHEFRSPLAGINQLGEMLRDGRVENEGRRQEYYGMIVAETQRLRRLVENVLDFARMEEGRKQYRFESVEPAAWLSDVAEDFQAQVAARGFALEASIPQELPTIVADRETLTTAVHNLLDNAVKYSCNSHTVRLEARSNHDGVSISVCDRGVGIREEDRSRIFEKFYRGGGDLARQVKGVGLGLNLVQHIVTAHGGTIDVDSREGEGSTFTIHLKTERRTA